MNKPQWHINLEKLNDEALAKKRKDILLCIQSCRKESLIGYNTQLDAVDEIIATRKQIAMNFDEEEPPLFV